MTTSDEQDQNAVVPGMKHGKQGGIARAEKLTPEQRKTIARQGAEARWAAARRTKANAVGPGGKPHIKVLLTEEQREALEQAAKPSGQSVSTWMLTVALERARSG